MDFNNSTHIKSLVSSFEQKLPTKNEEKLIRVLLDNPGGTVALLSTKIGKKPNVWDMQFGNMCRRRLIYIGLLNPVDSKKIKGYIQLLTIYNKKNQTYVMKSKVAADFRQIFFK